MEAGAARQDAVMVWWVWHRTVWAELGLCRGFLQIFVSGMLGMEEMDAGEVWWTWGRVMRLAYEAKVVERKEEYGVVSGSPSNGINGGAVANGNMGVMSRLTECFEVEP